MILFPKKLGIICSYAMKDKIEVIADRHCPLDKIYLLPDSDNLDFNIQTDLHTISEFHFIVYPKWIKRLAILAGIKPKIVRIIGHIK